MDWCCGRRCVAYGLSEIYEVMAKKVKKKKGGSKTCQKVSSHKRAGKSVKSYGRKKKNK